MKWLIQKQTWFKILIFLVIVVFLFLFLWGLIIFFECEESINILKILRDFWDYLKIHRITKVKNLEEVKELQEEKNKKHLEIIDELLRKLNLLANKPILTQEELEIVKQLKYISLLLNNQEVTKYF